MALASRSNRSLNCSAETLSATIRSSRVSRAFHTSPIPPRPMSAMHSCGPSFSPGESGIYRIQLSLADQKKICAWITRYTSTIFPNDPTRNSFNSSFQIPDNRSYRAIPVNGIELLDQVTKRGISDEMCSRNFWTNRPADLSAYLFTSDGQFWITVKRHRIDLA